MDYELLVLTGAKNPRLKVWAPVIGSWLYSPNTVLLKNRSQRNNREYGQKMYNSTTPPLSLVSISMGLLYMYINYIISVSLWNTVFFYISGIHRSIQWSCRSGNEKTDCSRMRKKAHILRHHNWFAHETMSEKRTKKFDTDDASLTPRGTQQIFIRPPLYYGHILSNQK